MSTISWPIRSFKLGLYEISLCVAFVFLISGCHPCSQIPNLLLDWGVIDKDTNVETNKNSGDSFQIDPSHHYIVTLRANDPDGIKYLAIWGDGNFTCSTNPECGVINTWPSPLSSGIAKKEVTNPSSGYCQDFIMSDTFIYYGLSCGKQYASNYSPPCMPGYKEFWVKSGVLHIHGEETSGKGTKSSASLDLTP